MAVKGDFECKTRHTGRNVEENTLTKVARFWMVPHPCSLCNYFYEILKRKTGSIWRALLHWFCFGQNQAPTQRQTDFHSIESTYSQDVNRYPKDIEISSETCRVSPLSDTLLSQYLTCKQVVISKSEASLQSEKLDDF